MSVASSKPVLAADTPLLSPLLRLAGPVVVSRLGIMAMGVVDTVVVGRYSATELGYHALGWAPTGVVLTTALGLLYGVQVMTAQAIGEGRITDTGAILRRGLVYAFWIGIASALILAGLGGPLMHNIGLDAALADGSTPVVQIFALSLLPILLADAGMFWLEAHGRPIPGMIAMWAANALNLVFNLWLVPGTSGFPVDGAVASAVSTALSRLALMVFVGVIIWRWHRSREYGVFAPTPDDPQAAAAQRKIGYGTASSYFVETLAFGSMSIFAGWIGALAIATWAVVLNIAAVIFMIPLGLGTATAVMVGRAHGARDANGVRRVGRLGFAVTFAVQLAICVGIALWNEQLAAAYTLDPEVQVMVASALLLSCLFFVADGLQIVAGQALRARSDVWLPTATHILSFILVMMPLAWFLAIPMELAVEGLVWGIVAASLIAASLLWTRFWWLTREN